MASFYQLAFRLRFILLPLTGSVQGVADMEEGAEGSRTPTDPRLLRAFACVGG